MTIADRFAAWIGAIGVIVVGGLNYFASTESDKVKVDIEWIGLAKSVLQDPRSSPGLRYWAVQALGTWQQVPLTPEEKKKIAEQTVAKPLDSIPEAMELNKKLTGNYLWEQAGDINDILTYPGSIGTQPSGEPMPATPKLLPMPENSDQFQQQPGTGTNSPETQEQQ